MLSGAIFFVSVSAGRYAEKGTMTLLIGLAMGRHLPLESTPFVALTQITIDAFSRDRTLFDSGVAVGRNSADIPLSGTGTIGETIQLRFVREDGTMTEWNDVTVVSEDGNWQATESHSRHPTWIRPEVRIKSEPLTRALGSNRFGVGHVIALWGQSEVVRIRSLAHNLVAPETLLADDMVQAIWIDGTPVVKHLSDADPHTAALAAMANVFLSEISTDKVAIVFHAESGTGFRQLVDDNDPNRSWQDDAALHAFATADGQHVGLPSVSWFASPGALGESYGEALFPIFTGKELDGTPITFPAQISYGTSGNFTAHHWFGELYDHNFTRWVPFGPHRFDITEDMQNAKMTAGGSVHENLSNKQATRLAWREMISNPSASEWFLPLGSEPLSYRNGVSDGVGGWTDESHPSGDHDDGISRYARLTAYAILQASGLSNWSVPEFDQCDWESSGAYVEVWSSAGPVTTIRNARGETALGSEFSHWTDVMGWQVNGSPATRAELVSGRIRIYPEQGLFSSTDIISYGEGGATGAVKYPEDALAETYKNLPIVDVGASRIEGIGLRPLPSAAVLANTLTPVAPSFQTAVNGPHFRDPLSLGAGVNALHFSLDFGMSLPASGSRTLVTTTGNYLKLEVLPSGALRVRVRDGDGTVKTNNVQTASGLVADLARVDVVMSVDLVAGFVRVWADGVLALDESFAAGSGLFPDNRALLLLATANGSYQVEGVIHGLDIWKDAAGDGSNPASPAYKSLSGTASAINMDPWKLGGDAV